MATEITIDDIKLTETNKINIDMSQVAISSYELSADYFQDNSIVVEKIPENYKLIGYLFWSNCANITYCNFDWGYQIKPDTSIKLSDFKKIKFDGNLSELCSSSITTTDFKIVFAMLGCISRHVRKKILMVIIGKGANDTPNTSLYI